jgi:hypothetical protein
MTQERQVVPRRTWRHLPDKVPVPPPPSTPPPPTDGYLVALQSIATSLLDLTDHVVHLRRELAEGRALTVAVRNVEDDVLDVRVHETSDEEPGEGSGGDAGARAAAKKAAAKKAAPSGQST